MTYIDSQAKLLQHVDRIAALKAGERPAPVNVEIDLSNRCSLGCSWCHFSYTHVRGPLAGKSAKPANATPGGDLMPVWLALSIIDQLAEAGVRSVTWTGGGEPTLHPEFDRIVGYADGKLEQGLYTHGGHITEARAQLLKYALTFAYVSLDAADAESYQRWKGVNRFDAACDGIKRLAAADGDCTVGVGFLLNSESWHDADLMVGLGAALGADYVQFRPIIIYDVNNPSGLAEDLSWMDEALVYLEEFEGLPGVELDLERFRMYQAWDGHGYETCWWSGVQAVVTPNGKMWTCANKREHASAELGDLSQECFADIWSRHEPAWVGSNCRVMCRGHIPNLALAEIMNERAHAAFI